jgi:hypothetical protein
MFGTVLESKPTVDSMMIEADAISRPNTARRREPAAAITPGGIERAHHYKNTDEKEQRLPINVRQDAGNRIDVTQVDYQEHERRAKDRHPRRAEPDREAFTKDEQGHHQRQNEYPEDQHAEVLYLWHLDVLYSYPRAPDRTKQHRKH